MKITFKLYASLTELLPAQAKNHAIEIDVDESTTAWDLIDRFKIPRKSAHLVLINGIYLEPEERVNANLTDGDTVAIWPPVAGG